MQGGGELDYNVKTFKYASVMSQDDIYSILDGNSLNINSNQLPLDKVLYHKRGEAFVNHIASIINNGWNGLDLGNDRLYAIKNVLPNGEFNIILLKNNPNSLKLDNGLTSFVYANNNSIDPSLKTIKVPIINSELEKHIQYRNIPLNLTPRFNAINTKEIEVILEGKANTHKVANSISNASFSLDSNIVRGALFVDSAKNININFVEQVELKNNNKLIFKESSNDDGSIANDIKLTFKGTIDTTITDIQSYISVIGLPRGLDVSYTIANKNNLILHLDNKAVNHKDPDDDTSLVFNFDKRLFTSSPVNVYKTSIDFINKANVTASDKFVEKQENDGSIRNNITLNISNDYIASGVQESDLPRLITPITNVPLGLNPSFVLIDKTTIEVTLEGSALNHASIDSVNNVKFDFVDSLFHSNVPVDPATTEVKFFDNIIITPNITTFNEDVSDIGLIATTITLDTTFGGGITQNIANNAVISPDLYKIENLPLNLNPRIVKKNSSTIEVSLIGNSISHDAIDDINNLKLTFDANIFSNKLNSMPLDFNIAYLQKAKLVPDTSFIEDELDNAKIGNNVTITIDNDSILSGIDNTNIAKFITMSPTINNLNPKYNILDDSHIEISLDGVALKHLSDVDDAKLNFKFDSGIFSNSNYFTDVPIDLDFINRATFSTKNNFKEKRINDGTILNEVFPNSVVLTITNPTEVSLKKEPTDLAFVNSFDVTSALNSNIIFNKIYNLDLKGVNSVAGVVDAIHRNGAGFYVGDGQIYAAIDPANANNIILYKTTSSDLEYAIANTNNTLQNNQTITSRRLDVVNYVAMQNRITPNNLPNNLTASYSPLNLSQVEVRLGGIANKHSNIDDVNNLNFIFDESIFDDGVSANSSNVKIDFIDNIYTTVISGFEESVANDGSISNYAIVSIPNSVINKNMPAGAFTLAGLPSGLSLDSFTRLNQHELRIDLVGRANNHNDINDAYVTLNFNDQTAFTPNGLPFSAKIPIDFKDAPQLKIVNSNIFKEENINDGSMTNIVTINVANSDKIIGDPNALIDALNLPHSLTASFELIDDYNIRMFLNGKSALNDDIDDIDNISLSFDGGLFESGIKPNGIQNISLDFIDTPKISIKGHFEENGSRHGIISQDKKVTITMIDDNFTTDKGDITNSITLENLPIGVSHNASILNPSQVEVGIYGNVASHADIDTINDIKINFVDDSIFSSSIIPQSASGVSLLFFNYTPTRATNIFQEGLSNNGHIDNEVTIENTLGLFNIVPDEDLNKYMSITNIPTYFTPSFRMIDYRHIGITLNGRASLHQSVNNIDLSLHFNDKALFQNSVISDDIVIPVEYVDSNSAVAIGEFKEISNSGKYEGTVLVTIDGDTFKINSPLTDTDVILSTLPAGVSSKVRYMTENILEITLQGLSLSHSVADDRLLDIKFANPNIFTSGSLPSPIKGIKLSNNDPITANVIGVFSERSDDVGFISSAITVELKTDTFDSGTSIAQNINISNLPIGLDPAYKLINTNQLEISLKGKALLDHTHDKEITIDFKPSLFTGKVPLLPIITTIDFLTKSQGSIIGSFKESALNNGTMISGASIRITNGLFSQGTSIPIVASNVPSGLSATYRYIDNKNIAVDLIGSAISHNISDSIQSLEFNIDKTAFVDATSLKLDNIPVSFIEAPDIVINGDFIENIRDNGEFLANLSIIVKDDEILNADLNKLIDVNGLPNGLSANFRRISANQIVMNLTGSALSHSSLDSTKINLDFKSGIFKSGRSGGASRDIGVTFRDTPRFSSKNYIFNESVDNPGMIENKITLALSGDTFLPNVDPTSFVGIKDLPLGLNPRFEINGNNLIVSLEGEARYHSEINSVNNISLSFKDGMFSKGVKAKEIVLGIDFVDTSSFAQSGSFVESIDDNGSITGKLTLTLNGDRLNNINPNNFISVKNLPPGLKPRFNIIDNATMVMELVGNANAHKNNNDISNMELSYKPELFESGIKATDTKNIKVDFNEPPSVSASNVFLESINNDGTIRNIVTLQAINDYFDDSKDPNKLIKVANLPQGLTPNFSLLNGKIIIMRLDGTSSNHAKQDNALIDLSFDKTLFKKELQAEGIGIGIVYDDLEPAKISTDGQFEEDIQNDGSIVTSVMMYIENDTIKPKHTLKKSFLIQDIYSIVQKNTGEQTINIGNESVKVDTNLQEEQMLEALANDINNNGEGTDGFYATIPIDTKSKRYLAILSDDDTINSVKIGQNGTNTNIGPYFNKGETGYKNQQITLGDKVNFLNIDRKLPLEYFFEKYITSLGVPSGLTPKYEKIKEDIIKVELIGNARDHLNEDDTQILFDFSKDMFKKELKPKTITTNVDYIDPKVFLKSNFKENIKNDGSVDGRLYITLYGNSFIDVNDYDKYINIKNLPAGLTPKITKESDSILTVTLEGYALNHKDIDDVSNMYVTFDDNIFTNDAPVSAEENIKIDFMDPYSTSLNAGGPGKYGGYLTFVSRDGKNLIISSAGADFGTDGNEYQTTLTLSDAIRKRLNTDQLYGAGILESPELIDSKESWGIGLTSVQGAQLVLDTINTAMENLNKIRANIDSITQRIKLANEQLAVKKMNIESVHANLTEIDFAEETQIFNKKSILAKAGDFTLSQSVNLQKNMILDLVKNSGNMYQ
ncbi:Flagellin [hydrothermal vent metagenome]|uniref:Flagellin n=1 Tax=hydrothermal vent metagenome TaxID=652676 RepID=A0A3B1DU18_9ZZZZ